MKRIYKYPLKVTDEQEVAMPSGAECLTVQMQDDIPCLWALVDPEADKIKYHILIHGTGHAVNSDKIHKYISTFQMHGGALIFHAFIGNY